MSSASTPVALSLQAGAVYPPDAPFSPATDNQVLSGVRAVLRDLGLDAAHAGQADWNPLGDLLQPGQRVLIKPNLVLDRHPRGGDLFALITHGSVVRALLDFAARALEGRGTICIGDSPLQTTDFEAATQAAGLAAVCADARRRHPGLDVQLLDFRKVVSQRDERGHIAAWREAAGDPAGYAVFDLAADSALAPLGPAARHFRVSNYEAADTQQYHAAASHRYVIARSVLDADLIINVPKLKTHCKVGVTLGLKNFVGTVGRKQCLAHHREGGAGQGGDEYPGRSLLKRWSEQLERRIDGTPAGVRREALKLVYRVNERLIRTLGLNPVRDGGWYGNDTCWRMTLDLVRIARYGRADGTMADTPQRPILTLLDGITAGEGEGPLEAVARPTGALLGGLNPVQVDRAAARFMGFDPDRIPLLRGALQLARWPLASGDADDVRVNGEPVPGHALGDRRIGPPFAPPLGWVGHMESGHGGA